MADRTYIWQQPKWPDFFWSDRELLPLYGEVCKKQGALLAQVKTLGISGDNTYRQARLEVLTTEAVKSSEVEGVSLNLHAVRSSLARRLGLPTAGIPDIRDRYADGIASLLLDATENYAEPLTDERLCGWQAAMFPGGYSDLKQIRIGAYRTAEDGPMEIVSGPIERPKVHYLAPPGEVVQAEMRSFLDWWEASRSASPDILRAGLAHLWFVAIHPFEDGNGRIARTIADMALAQAEKQSARFYSLSAQIMKERKSYYRILEKTNQGSGDITEWQHWFLTITGNAIDHSGKLLETILAKTHFCQAIAHINLNEKQRKVVLRMLDGFEGGMTTKKYKGLAHTSPATAQRDLADLVNKSILSQTPGTAGRSTSYQINWKLLGKQ